MIEKTLAFQRMDSVQQRITKMASSKRKIHYHLQLLQNVGVERWQELNQMLPTRWKNIVLELNKVKK